MRNDSDTFCVRFEVLGHSEHFFGGNGGSTLLEVNERRVHEVEFILCLGMSFWPHHLHRGSQSSTFQDEEILTRTITKFYKINQLNKWLIQSTEAIFHEMAKWCTVDHAQVVYRGPCPSGVPWCMITTWSTTYVVEKCDVMWKLPHPVLTGGSERQLRKLTFGIDLSDYNVG
ncbi:hypothetical protein AVEN_107320-1 [Araneus ventricosus]|uniref:Uncharacterized protein n=1 Tax=Araneus ventricosus TaxID=182803 RepID=A0A4Y2JTG1_ARAVE|nr:hypothetical protein AVEN_107320-1 [Araneus ventricosus]